MHGCTQEQDLLREQMSQNKEHHLSGHENSAHAAML
jgi:hypothetical protein